MLREIDLTKKPATPKLSIARPNRTIIGNLNEAFNIRKNEKLGRLNELSFDIPYEIDRHNTLVPNPNIEKTRERYLIKFTYNSLSEWFIINEINENMDEDRDVKSVHAYSLAYELRDKLVRNYKAEAYNVRQILTDLLPRSIWNIGEIHTTFDSRYRSFDVTEKSLLDFIFELAQTFGAIVQFDTERRLIHFRTEEEIRIQRGMKVSYGDLLKTLNRKSSPDEMITRLHVYGKDQLSINRVNPTGASYIESFKWFMYPFEAVKKWEQVKEKKWSEL